MIGSFPVGYDTNPELYPSESMKHQEPSSGPRDILKCHVGSYHICWEQGQKGEEDLSGYKESTESGWWSYEASKAFQEKIVVSLLRQ